MTQTPTIRLIAVLITALALCGLLICATSAFAQDKASEPEPPLEEVLIEPEAPAPTHEAQEAPAPVRLEVKEPKAPEQTAPDQDAPEQATPEKQAAPETPAAPVELEAKPEKPAPGTMQQVPAGSAPVPMGIEAKPEEPETTDQEVPEGLAPEPKKETAGETEA
ncbi:MAG: hypothetical protein SVS15_10825, partial [Thermodesulfobacteriota bacterium]|nr:hypothetical protein [Thermodesulfobacteriota bacterium]